MAEALPAGSEDGQPIEKLLRLLRRVARVYRIGVTFEFSRQPQHDVAGVPEQIHVETAVLAWLSTFAAAQPALLRMLFCNDDPHKYFDQPGLPKLLILGTEDRISDALAGLLIGLGSMARM